MVCNRCIMVIEQILDSLDIKDYKVVMGQIKLSEDIPVDKMKILTDKLHNVGFEVLEDKTEKTISSIKAAVVQYLDELANGEPLKMSSYITQHVYYDYSYLSDIFSKAANITIEKYFIELRVDKAKELLKYSSSDVSSIAHKLGFSSPQHFANQFKQHVGVTPSAYRKLYDVR